MTSGHIIFLLEVIDNSWMYFCNFITVIVLPQSHGCSNFQARRSYVREFYFSTPIDISEILHLEQCAPVGTDVLILQSNCGVLLMIMLM